MTLEPVVFVLRHTHWDREWYHPASVFRKRLVDLIDGLLEEPPNGTFLLDGQAIVLRDYLAVRPERAAELGATLQRGHLEAGPWYVLADELIPSGEALVRNLLAGRRALRAARAEGPPVLYCPDSFGHPAALPAIAAGFGCHSIIVWRGYGSRRFQPKDAATWTAPNGDAALLFHLPRDGYEFGSHLPASDEAARARWKTMRRLLQKRSALGIWLVPHGADHHAPQRDSAAAIAALRGAAAPVPVEVAGLKALAHLLDARASETKLPLVRGELRDSYGYTWTLGGTLATRAHQKRANAHIERDLLRDVEPWTALARMHGSGSARHHVHAAWETLLATHPHDSLCGCSIDDVAAAVDHRQRQAAALAADIRAAAISALLGHDPDAARARAGAWQAALIVRNRAPRVRSGVAEVVIDVELAHVSVGPNSAGKARPMRGRGALALPVQLISRERMYARTEAPRHYPLNHAIERRRALVWFPDVPAYGLAAFPLTERAPSRRPPVAVRGDTRRVWSDVGSLTSSRSGLVWLGSGTKKAVAPLFTFEMAGERGDTYTHSEVPRSLGRGVLRKSRVALRGPLRGAVDSEWRVTRRGARREAVAVTVRTALDAGAPFVRLSVAGDNSARDHRLRIVLRTGLRPRHVLADAAFALIERKPLRIPKEDARMESVPGTDPLHRFVTLFDGARGCTVVSDGLAEYEILRDGSVAITLVRAVGELSRGDLPERPGHAGWPEPTPGAQCPGPFGAELAMFWHGGDTAETRANIAATVDDVLLPLTGNTQRDLLTIPAMVTGLTLEGRGLAFSTLKESEDGRHVVARCVNVTDRPVDGAWILPRAVETAFAARLDETPGEKLSPQGTRVPFRVSPHGVHSVLVPLGEAGAR